MSTGKKDPIVHTRLGGGFERSLGGFDWLLGSLLGWRGVYNIGRTIFGLVLGDVMLLVWKNRGSFNLYCENLDS